MSAVAVAILALGLGLNVSAISVVNTLLLRPYPYPALDRLVLIRDSRRQEGPHQRNPIAAGDYLDVRRDHRLFEAVAAWRPQVLVVTGRGDPEAITSLAVSAAFFDVLGVRAVRGRTFATGEDGSGRDNVVVFSRRFWASHFGADPSLVGGVVTLNGRSSTVIGIVADEACYPSGADAWTPIVFTPADESERTVQRVSGIARVKDGVSAGDAQQDLDAIADRLARLHPETNRGRGFALLPLRKEQYEFTAALFSMVQAAALFVLALGFANVTHLLLARLADRRHELVIRRALGASSQRLFWQAVVEALVLTSVGGLLGILFAYWAVGIVRVALPDGIARWVAGWHAIRLDRTVAFAAGLLTLITGLLLGAATGVRVLRTVGAWSLKDGGRTPARHTRRGRQAFIAGEVSLAIVLLIAAGTMLRSFRDLGSAFATLGPDRLLSFSISLPDWSYPDDVRIVEFHDRLLRSLNELPGVESAALMRMSPASNVSLPPNLFSIDGRLPLSASETPRADLQTVSPAAFETLGVPLMAGRGFRDGDRPAAPRVAIISRAMAQRFWPGDSPLGRVLRLGPPASASVTVIGVASDLRLNWYDPEPRSVIYVPAAQAPARQTDVMVRTRTDPMGLARPVVNAVHALDPRQPISGLQPFREVVNESLAPVRVIGLLLLYCGGVAAMFAAIGISGVLAHWVVSRSHELGVRLALGATSGDLVRMVLKEAFQMAAVGIIVGVPLSVALSRVAASALLGLSSPTAEILVVVVVLALTMVSAAAAGPARRALRADPRVLLQSE